MFLLLTGIIMKTSLLSGDCMAFAVNGRSYSRYLFPLFHLGRAFPSRF